MYLKIKTIALLMSVFICSAKAQNFSYSIVKDSASYSPLAGASVLSVGENFRNKQFGVRLPFQFNFCGSLTDSILIKGNGFISFDENQGFSFVAFNNFSSRPDTNQQFTSSILTQTSGSAGNRVIKIEFRNVAQSTLSTYDHLNYQIWIRENGNSVELHIGSNSYESFDDMAQLLGLINVNMNTTNIAYLISGAPSAPIGQTITAESPLAYLNTIPATGLIYQFIPSF
jgi:hypothetical protein